MPFDWKTPFGYFVAWFGQAAGWTADTLMGVPQFIFPFGSSFLFIFIVEDITKDLADFNSKINTPNRNGQQAKEHFCQIIQIYLDAKE